MNFAKFIRTPFFTEHLRWLLLYLSNCHFIWSVCSVSDSCFCLICSISYFICLTKFVLEIRELSNFYKSLSLLKPFRFDIEQKTGQWSVKRASKTSDFSTYSWRFCEIKMYSNLRWTISDKCFCRKVYLHFFTLSYSPCIT